MGKYEAENTKGHWIPSPKIRAYLYGIVVALGALAVVYGIISENELGLWLSLAGAVLGLTNSLALANTGQKDAE